MWPFRSNKSKQPDAGSATEDLDSDGEYTEEEYEEEYEYEVEVTDDEAESSDGPDDDEDDHDLIVLKTSDVTEEPSSHNPTSTDSPDTERVAAAVVIQEDKPQDTATEEDLVVEPDTPIEEHSKDDIDTSDQLENQKKEEMEQEEPNEPELKEEEVERSVAEEPVVHVTIEDEESEGDEESEEDEETEDEDDEPGVTSLEEKHSLLMLAAEHDRVDILQSILSTDEDKLMLLNHELPPLHVAISFGSTNATNCLLRLGANPALRPDTDKKLQGRTAWELAFGRTEEGASPDSGGWFSPSKAGAKIKPVNMLPSKREGIRHAFTAEALRSIGADEHERLAQLLKSGMPRNMDIGGNKDIAGWCREMGATKCLNLVEPPKQESSTTPDVSLLEGNKKPQGHSLEATSGVATEIESKPIPSPNVVHRLSTGLDDVDSLQTRLEELDTLAGGLSSYLDNLAEEVSVCHGLLLMGNGASALASHVRSLKDQQEFLTTDLDDRTSKWADSEEELLAYMTRHKITDDGTLLFTARPATVTRRLSCDDPVQLRAQLGASENKIRKLRASIADMSEESDAAMKEVEKRGLTGGIQLVRKLREEIRELEFEISETKSGETLCRAKLQQLQARNRTDDHKPKSGKQPPPLGSSQRTVDDKNYEKSSSLVIVDQYVALDDPLTSESKNHVEVTDSADISRDVAAATNGHGSIISSGQSGALMKYNTQGGKGYMPLALWQILLRIIGLGRVAVKQQVEDLKKQSSSVMIV